MASDRTWAQLAEVCLELGREEEALEAVRKIGDSAEKRSLIARFTRLGLLELPEPLVHAVEAESESPVRDAATDVLRFLADDHMPLTVTVATLTFPLMVGLSGYLVGTDPSMVLPSLALLPALVVLALVVAIGRLVLVDSARGLDDAPDMPRAGELARQCKRAAGDVALAVAVCLGPLALSIFLGLPWYVVGSTAAAGILLLPMTVGLRSVRGDWASLSPRVVVPAVCRTGTSYCNLFAVLITLAAPAAISLLATSASDVFMRVTLTGPLAVVPMLIAARLMGRFLHEHRHEVALVPAAAQPCAATRRRRSSLASRASAAAAPVAAPRPGSGAGTPAATRPGSGVRVAVAARPGGRRDAATRPPSGVQRDRAGRPDASRPGSSSFHTAVRPDPAPARRPPARRRPPPQAPVDVESLPDLTHLPGVSVVRGEDREAAGAASSRRRGPGRRR